MLGTNLLVVFFLLGPARGFRLEIYKSHNSSPNDTMLPRGENIPTDDDLFLSCPGANGSPNIRRADRCTLINVVDNPDQVLWKSIGNAQLNCGGSTTATEVKLRGSASFFTSTKLNGSLGITYQNITFENGGSGSQSETEATSQEITYAVLPGRQAVYTIGYNHKSQTGNVQVNFGKRVADHYIWYTGSTVTTLKPDVNTQPSYQVHATECGTDPYDINNSS